VAVVARAAETGSTASAGYALAALSLGSAAGGLIWGRRQHTHPYRRQLLTLLAALAVGTAAAGLAPTLPALAAVLALAGLAVAPIFVVAYLAADLITAQDTRTEATTWVATASNLGGALGAAGAGYLVDQTSAQTALLLAAATMALAAAALSALRSRTPASGTVLTPR
jgi:predicted MFS family arabinose efflux permease